MIYQLDGKNYKVEIIRKHNKNTYIRVKEDLTIYVTTNRLATKGYIKKLLDENTSFLIKAIKRANNKKEKEENFYLLGICYNVVYSNDFKKISIDTQNKIIYIKDQKMLNNWVKKETKNLYLERIDYNYKRFEEKIPYPNLRVRKMSTRWGVCNRKLKVITLNSKLIEYSIDKLDYVIIHELSHFVHFDHSKLFWNVVSKYCPNYKFIRKELND